MKITKDSKYKLLVQKLKKISDIIDSDNSTEENVYEAVIDFIFVLEYVVKKILYAKNKLLIYEFNFDINKATVIIKSQKNAIHTIQLSEALSRYVKIFPKSKLSKLEKSIEILITNRNELEHYIDIKNMQSREELLGILSSIFPVFLKEAERVLGALPSTKIKKERTYSEKDIQDIYDNMVLSKIKNYRRNNFQIIDGDNSTVWPIKTTTDDVAERNGVLTMWNGSNLQTGRNGEFCPRCSKPSLYRKYPDLGIGIYRPILLNGNQENSSDLYICSNCNLELTQLEYDTVERLKREGKISMWRF